MLGRLAWQTNPELRADWFQQAGSLGILGVSKFHIFVFNEFLGSNGGAKFLKGSFLFRHGCDAQKDFVR